MMTEVSLMIPTARGVGTRYIQGYLDFLLLNLRQLLVTDWTDFNLLHAGITWTAYNSITILITTGVCALVAFLYYRYWYDRIKRLLHRQKLARMILENKLYEADAVQDSVFLLTWKADQGKNSSGCAVFLFVIIHSHLHRG